MREVRRALLDRKFLVVFVLCFVVNVVLFCREQYNSDLGLNLKAGNVSQAVNSGEMAVFTDIKPDFDVKKCYQVYLEMLNNYKNTDPIWAENDILQKQETLQNIPTEELTKETKMELIAIDRVLVQLKHINGYSEYLEEIENNSKNLKNFSIFNQKDTFESRNINKTAEEFQKLEDVKLSLGVDGLATSFVQFKISDYLVLLVLIVCCLKFTEERKPGLWNTIYATKNGRLWLAFWRTATVFIAIFGITCIFYGANLATGALIFGDGELGRAVQSAEIFGKTPFRFTFCRIIFRILLMKIGAFFLLGLFLWFTFSALSLVFGGKMSVFVVLTFLVGEFTLFNLPTQTNLNFFKYFNIFTYINSNYLYTNYLNVDLLGYPVGIRAISETALPILCCFFLGGCLISCFKKPVERKVFFPKTRAKINKFTDCILGKVSIFGIECYKILVLQKGFIVIAIFTLIISSWDFAVNIPPKSPQEAFKRVYINELQGKIDENTHLKLQNFQVETENTMTEYLTNKEKYENGELTFGEFYSSEQENFTAILQKSALENIGARLENADWLVDDVPFRAIYGKEAKSVRVKVAGIVFVTIIFLIVGVFACEKRAGVENLLRSTPKGRGKLLKCKILVVALVIVLIWAIVAGFELRELLKIVNGDVFNAPVQSVEIWSNIAFEVSIGGFLVLVNVVRLGVMLTFLGVYLCVLHKLNCFKK